MVMIGDHYSIMSTTFQDFFEDFILFYFTSWATGGVEKIECYFRPGGLYDKPEIVYILCRHTLFTIKKWVTARAVLLLLEYC